MTVSNDGAQSRRSLLAGVVGGLAGVLGSAVARAVPAAAAATTDPEASIGTSTTRPARPPR
jgi:hypothetical protein